MAEHEELKYKEGKLKTLHVRCSECGKDVPVDDIDLGHTLAKCRECNSIFSIEEDIKQWDRNRPEIFMPDGLDVLKLSNELDIELSWFRSASRAGTAFMAFFSIFWNILLLPIVFTATLQGQFEVLLFTSIHIMVGLGMLARLAATFINKTYISVTKNRFQIQHKPIGIFKRKKTFETSQIKQLFVTRHVKSRTNGKPNFAYALYAILHGNQKIKILDGMNKETQQYLEQEIEQFLEIKDQKIRGEAT